MGHSSVRLKVRRRKVAHLAAFSRQFTVHNSTIPATGKKLIVGEGYQYNPFQMDKKELEEFNEEYKGYTILYRAPYNLPHFLREVCSPGQLFKYNIEPNKYGLHLEELPSAEWENTKHPQPKMFRKNYKKKYYNKGTHDIRKVVTHPSEFPTCTVKKMNRTEYMEALVQHKLERWVRKNPQPCETDDLFKPEFLTEWYDKRDKAQERFRDFVVSIYDKLPLIGRFKIKEEATAAYQEEKIAELKDINGDGHKVNELNENSKLLKQAKKTVNKVKAKRQNLVSGNLKDHKRTKGRIILPDNEMRKAA